MNKARFGSAVALCALALAAAAVATEVRAAGPAVDPAATKILKKMTDHLGGLKRFSVQTQNTLEERHHSGHRVDLDVSASVTVSRPNKLRSERKGESLDQVFTYDGTTLTLYNPAENVYATEAVPDTFEGMFKQLYEKFGFGIPASDLVYADAFPLLMKEVDFATVIGKTYIGGVRCDHLLFGGKGVDFQLWVADGGQPLPQKFVVTDTSTPDRLSVTTLLSGWQADPAVDDAYFSFTPPKGAKAIPFLPF